MKPKGAERKIKAGHVEFPTREWWRNSMFDSRVSMPEFFFSFLFFGLKGVASFILENQTCPWPPGLQYAEVLKEVEEVMQASSEEGLWRPNPQ